MHRADVFCLPLARIADRRASAATATARGHASSVLSSDFAASQRRSISARSDWAAVRPGVRLRLGSAECVVSAWADPCSNIAGCFVDRDFRRIDAARGPVARAYATVTRPGSVSVGDPILAGPATS